MDGTDKRIRIDQETEARIDAIVMARRRRREPRNGPGATASASAVLREIVEAGLPVVERREPRD